MKTKKTTYQVKEVAALSGVTVRTLHHYDKIGLLRPTARTSSGYRLYSEDALFRLQQIIIGREMGLSLEDIRASLDAPDFDLRAMLVRQRQCLEEKKDRTETMLKAIDTALASIDGTAPPQKTGTDSEEKIMSQKARPDKTMFKGFSPDAYGAEAKEKWGHTEMYAESQRRSGTYSKDDWDRLNAEQGMIFDALATEMRAGKAPDDPVVQSLVQDHRAYIDRWFYPCSMDMHAALADMYRQDARFQRTIDTHGDGLALYLADAIQAQSPSPAS
ncbi:HTH-type transcriptional activator TipA [Kordiimonas sediminis]|uniref:HTH-type transcriptional activator TipA n=1 Tax=Kordiimonas sediminis TaxID=1735581 RepID=A0A919AN17_9PROT|nr:MerR family transcriptional regulator [Kordiimonas sediminis]GHF16403.1 HTH-type transcriptional activator TipA [Kordiimonas sediminis]